jgi:hypothetical protein
MLSLENLERLRMLVTVADYDGDNELKQRLDSMISRERSRALLNRTDEHGKELPRDGKRRA